MNSTGGVESAYIGSELYTTNLEKYRQIIRNDFEVEHILKHKNYFANVVTDNYESNAAWFNSDIDLMNEAMAYGSNIFHNSMNGNILPANFTIDKSQLSLFRLRPDSIVTLNDSGERQWYWLRDVVSSAGFAIVLNNGSAYISTSASLGGIRPAFLIV